MNGIGVHSRQQLRQGFENFPAVLCSALGRRIEHQPVLEELLDAEELEIGVIYYHPAITHRLVGEIMHVFEDRDARHQMLRQRRKSSPRSRACACAVRRHAAQDAWDRLHSDDRARPPLPRCLSLFELASIGQGVLLHFLAKIFIAGAAKKDDGTLEAAAISVGRAGITPPM